MAILAQQLLVGNVGKVYDLRSVGKDKTAVVDFSMAITPRKRQGDDWVDGETYWVNVTAWGKLAENVEASFKSGDRIFVYGRTEMKESYTNREGEKMPARPIVVADYAGLEISYAPAESKRTRGGSSGGSSNPSRSSAPAARNEEKPAPAKVEDDLFADDDFDFGDDSAPF